MNKILMALLALFMMNKAHAQTYIGEAAKLRNNITLRGVKVTDFQKDSAFSLDTKIPTSKAVKDYVAAHAGAKLDTTAGYINAIRITTPNVLYTTPIDFSVTNHWASAAMTLNTQTANTVFAGAISGGAAQPTFRALVAADLPTIPETKGGTNLTTYSTGDIIFGSGPNTLSRLPIGTPKQTLHVVSGVPAWRDTVTVPLAKGTYSQRPASPDTGQIFWQTNGLEGRYEYDGLAWGFVGKPQQYIVNDQFAFNIGNNSPQHLVVKVGTGSAAASNYTDVLNKSHAGVWKMQTGTTSTGLAAINANNSNYGTLDSMIIYNEEMIRLPTLSTGTDRYVFQVGFNSSYSPPPNINSAYSAVFQYCDSLSSGNWSTMTSNSNGTISTLKDTGIPVTTEWVKLGVKSIQYGTKKIEFYINDILVQTHTSGTDIGPFTGSQENYSASSIIKTAGTADRIYLIDYSLTYKIK